MATSPTVSTGRRVARRLLLGGLLLVLVLMAGTGLYALVVDPLEPGVGSAVAAGVQSEDPDATGRFRYGFRFVALGPVRWGLDVRNRLLVPLTIQGLDGGGEAPSAPVTGQTLNLLAGESMG